MKTLRNPFKLDILLFCRLLLSVYIVKLLNDLILLIFGLVSHIPKEIGQGRPRLSKSYVHDLLINHIFKNVSPGQLLLLEYLLFEICFGHFGLI